MACLDLLIGKYSGDCECLTKDVGTFPFYVLDDMKWSIPLNALNSSLLCGDSGLLTLADKAIKQAKQDLQNDISLKIQNEYSPIFKRFTGAVGQLPKATGYKIFTSGSTEGIKLMGYKGTFNVNALALCLDTTQTVNINISNNRGDTISPIEVSCVANAVSKVDTDITLALSDEVGRIEWYIEYTYSGMAKNIQFSCGCSDDNYKQIQKWFSVSGINGDRDTLDNYTHGLIMSGTAECQVSDLICSMTSRNDSKAVISRMLQFYAIQSLGSYFLKSTEINSYTTIGKESIAAHMEELQSQIEWRLDWIFSKTDIHNNCWVCKTSSSFERRSLIV